MNRTSGRRLLCASLFAILLASAAAFVHAEQWTTPTPEELSMTSQPQVPGAAAVYLYREEITNDDLHEFTIYTRLKVLTEGGKDQGTVELKYASYREGVSFTVDDVQGRTIHPDGTIIPFTGKPYQKLLEKGQGVKVMSKVFSMPNVEVGSIIEYRYKIRYDDDYVVPPSWYIQSELFTRKAYYAWRPTARELSNNRGTINTIGWFRILPADIQVKETVTPPTTLTAQEYFYEVNIDNVPPAPDEDFMPPIHSLTDRVLFYYLNYRKPEEFWKAEGKQWSKDRDKFIGPGHSVTAAVKNLTSATDTQDQKLRKIYAAVMQLENTDFTREHSTSEEKAEGLKVHDTDDIWNSKRGNDEELTELFIAMARAAGMKAYVLAVTNRDRNIFLKGYLSFDQLDDYLAIVNVDGKEEYFDPGSRYCPYQHLAWKHSMADGLRQTNDGADFAESPRELITASDIQRIGDLTMDEHGVVAGTLKMTFTGAPALSWRQKSLAGDATSLENDLRTSVEQLVPQGMVVKVASIEKLADYEQPLTVNFEVKGAIGSATGTHLFLPADIFEANAKTTFPQEKRDIPVYFSFPYMMQDAVRVKYPATFSVESSPAADKVQLKNFAGYSLSTLPARNSITVRRDYALGEIIYLPDEYAGLRSFYSKMETDDQGNIVLTTAPVSAKSTTAAK